MSKPWAKVLDYGPGEPGEDVDRTGMLASEALRLTGILLQPYMPNKAKLLLDQLGVHEDKRTLAFCQPGADLDYGTPMVPLGSRQEGVMFPTLTSEE